MYTLEFRKDENIEEKVKQLYEEISKNKAVVISGVRYNVENVTVMKGRGMVSGWEIVLEGDPSTYDFVLRDRDERTYMTIHMKKPGIVIGLGISPDNRRNDAVIVYNT